MKEYEIEYEPFFNFNHIWTPDFSISKDGHIHYLVEVKPESRMFDISKYLICPLELEDQPKISCMTARGQLIFNLDVGFEWKKNDMKVYFQSYNNINSLAK